MDACPFCEIMKGHDDIVAVIEPLNPVTPGHRLAIPSLHVQDAGEEPALTAEVMYRAAQYAASLGCDYNLITSAGPDATQTVYHLHIHIVPRHAGDGLHLPWTGQIREGAD